jgi:hypothetical protein
VRRFGIPEFTITPISDTVINIALVDHRPCECRLRFQTNRDLRIFRALSPDFDRNHRLGRESRQSPDQEPEPGSNESAIERLRLPHGRW